MEGEKACEKDGKVRRGLRVRWVGAEGRSCSPTVGAGTLEPTGKSPAVAESVVVMEGHVVAT